MAIFLWKILLFYARSTMKQKTYNSRGGRADGPADNQPCGRGERLFNCWCGWCKDIRHRKDVGLIASARVWSELDDKFQMLLRMQLLIFRSAGVEELSVFALGKIAPLFWDDRIKQSAAGKIRSLEKNSYRLQHEYECGDEHFIFTGG